MTWPQSISKATNEGEKILGVRADITHAAAGSGLFRDGTPLWHSRLQEVSNAPETCLLDDHQYVMVAAGDMVYAFALY
ncbi:MAG TPA: hypothetical protein VKP66_20865 [Steroidobacteraceae bacterium]|nr:hypothetical protein [Steroidobacteraceae bacterium]